MTAWVEVRVPDEPECWHSCGTCRTDTLTVIERLASPQQKVALYQPLVVLEAYKTEMEVPSPAAGIVAELFADVGDELAPGELLALIAP